MTASYKIYDGVLFQGEAIIEDYCIVGVPFTGAERDPIETIIGPGATLRSHTVIYAGNTIGANFKTGNKVNIRELNSIGDNVSIGTHSVIEHHVTIGNNVRLHSQVFVPEYSILEDDVRLGPNVVLTNAKYPFSPDAKKTMKGPHLKNGAIIGANVTVLPGIIIGIKALVGAGAVVVKDVPDGAVVAGNPARVIKHISDLPY